MPLLSTITSFYTFAATTVIKSAEVNNNFSIFRGNILPVDLTVGAAAVTRTFDLGAADHSWRYIFGQNLNLYGETTTTTPAAGSYSIYIKASDGKAYIKNSSAVETALGSGGGGGGGSINWIQSGGNAATYEIDATTNQEVFAFEDALTQEIYTIIKIPSTYTAATAIKMRIGFYSPSTSNTVLFTAQSTLIKKNTTAFTSVTNQRTTTNTAVTMATTANKYNETELDLSSSIGEINAVACAAGDFIKVKLYRGTGTDTAIARMIPGATEVIAS